MTIRELINLGVLKLNSCNIKNSKNEARLLMCHILKFTYSDLFLKMENNIDEDYIKNYLSLISKRCEGVPLQQITKIQEFMGLKLKVNSKVLIPRRETEELVEQVLKRIKNNFKVLDLCAGSGAIGIAIARLSNASVICVDISKEALLVAEENTIINGVSEKVRLLQSDMFENINEEFDIIVSNPPYIKTHDINNLEKEVKAHEPLIALDGGMDGLKYYGLIVNEAFKHLKREGLLALEIGFDQGEEIKHIFENSGYYKDIIILKDLSGKDRILMAQKKEAEE